jgi:hypothetical protein
LYGCETWSLTLREEHRLRVLEKMALRRIFMPKRDEVTGNGEDCIMRSFMICTPHQIESRIIKWAGSVVCMGERCMQSLVV